MKLVMYADGEKKGIAVLAEDKVLPLQEAVVSFSKEQAEYSDQSSVQSLLPDDLLTLIEKGETALTKVKKVVAWAEQNGEGTARLWRSIDDIRLLPPLERPEKIICVGLNYMDHCKETGLEPPKKPLIFSKYANAIVGPDDAVELPTNSETVDYEAELTVVIGKTIKRVTEEEAADAVFGYTIMNDISARDIQFEDGQWVRGKSPDTFAPIGPAIVTKDAIEDAHNLDISLTLNGEVMQDSNTNNLIFRIPTIISYLSQSMTLKPGDIIATGTPHGVGMGRDPKVWLKDGDEMIIRVEGIGELRNVVRSAES